MSEPADISKMRLWALRGATKVERNDPGLIVSGTEGLLRELISRTSLEPERMVSCIFKATHDHNAEFPALAARSWLSNSVPIWRPFGNWSRRSQRHAATMASIKTRHSPSRSGSACG